ncbi:divergent polysaccharide deacetylase family protein [Octadecabacter ascidiaceicola]|uniref:Divergent polysaccharide deacetylase n=1 Tax=Octadecabacter ascidiaceicola TaxID=1655543 RepID=A0A238JM78_9RHOB|nr:divergent polysaccharide deacetylase family protein [Octadecabacter ascidiaceicola]SMX31523.1 Divergent polysaccharide deacetylase [Octadecabacter ascidiaceicola]
MRGMIGGVLAGGLVSALGLGTASLVTELPAGVTPPEPPLVEAPEVEPVAAQPEEANSPSTPVGSVSIEEPQAPALPENDATFGEPSAAEPDAPAAVEADVVAPRADTDPLDEPEVVAIEGAMEAPEAAESVELLAQPVDPVLPNPQSLAPQVPNSEADLTVSTTPSQPTIVIEPDVGVDVGADVVVADPIETNPEPEANEEDGEDFFVVDLGADALGTDAGEPDTPDTDVENVPTDQPADDILASAFPEPAAPRLQLQGGENSLLGDRGTGVTIRRPGAAEEKEEGEAPETAQSLNALIDYSANAGDVVGKPLMSIVLIDDGSMSAAAAALSGLSFPVTIALDPSVANATELMESYRASGFEVAVLAKLPEGALPSDVEVTFQSVFNMLPETVAVLDIGEGGLQSDRDVTQQAMDILAAQGRGFVSVSQGLNMAGRAAEAANVPAAVVYRELDAEDQDARVIRRFVDQAAFRARQESGVVLVGRVRPDTISALILWGTANSDDQVALVPVSAILTAE